MYLRMIHEKEKNNESKYVFSTNDTTKEIENIVTTFKYIQSSLYTMDFKNASHLGVSKGKYISYKRMNKFHCPERLN
jgi:hypothetical protein